MDHRLIHLQGARVLVIGDLILDRYWHGITRRISPEAPVPVVQISEVVERVGGAANVAANVAGLGGHVILIGVIGDDEDGRTLRRLVVDAGIVPDFHTFEGISTTVKLRVVSQLQQLVRIDFEDVAAVDGFTTIVDAFERRLSECEVAVVSDYAKGAVGRVEEIIQRALKAGKQVIVDPKGPNFSRYAGASLLTPNLKEFEAVVGACKDEEELTSKARLLLQELRLGALLITRGAAGMSLVEARGECIHVPASAQEVFDVTGAGDTVCGVLAAALATGSELPDAVMLANTAASLVVGKFGAATVSIDEIDAALSQRVGVRRGAVSRNELREECLNARRRGERIVMTNGCFDILHAGHVRYLSEAKTLGNRLIVAVNDDASVRALKGPARPLNNLEARMQVLAALESVDWVVSFDTATPQELIEEISPDVLVKGGDYDVSAVVGGDAVRAAGGQVVALEYHAGHSTTNIVRQLTPRSEDES